MASRYPRCVVALLLGLFAGAANAHGAMIGANDFIAGLVHPVTALEDALPLFLLGVIAGQNGLRRCESVFWLLPVAVAFGALAALSIPALPGIYLMNILSIVVLGLLVALAKRLPLAAIAVLAVLFGLSHGYANGMEITAQIRPAFFIPGVLLAAFFLVGYGTVLTDFLLRLQTAWVSIAVRVAGSWSAAIGLLVLSVSHRSMLLS